MSSYWGIWMCFEGMSRLKTRNWLTSLFHAAGRWWRIWEVHLDALNTRRSTSGVFNGIWVGINFWKIRTFRRYVHLSLSTFWNNVHLGVGICCSCPDSGVFALTMWPFEGRDYVLLSCCLWCFVVSRRSHDDLQIFACHLWHDHSWSGVWFGCLVLWSMFMVLLCVVQETVLLLSSASVPNRFVYI